MGFYDKLSPGEQIDLYRIEAVIAHSGMSTIYRATDLKNKTVVALKVPHPDIESDPVLFDRFQREADIGKKLDHPDIVRVLDVHNHSRVYMVMEWCGGRTLRAILSEGKLSQAHAVDIAIKLLNVVEYIHNNGIVHRDLKPENIMVDNDENIKLLDFGIAGDSSANRLTYANINTMPGTPDYLAPEQVKGKRGDARTDIYAIGVILYEMLAGKLPFTGDSSIEVMHQRLLNHPVPPQVADPAISPQLQEVLYRALERKPKNRYAKAREFATDLQHLDKVVTIDRQEIRDWKKRKSYISREILYYAALALLPVAILALMFLVAHHR